MGCTVKAQRQHVDPEVDNRFHKVSKNFPSNGGLYQHGRAVRFCWKCKWRDCLLGPAAAEGSYLWGQTRT